MKKCPYCAEEIQDEAIKCKHCKGSLKVDSSVIKKSKVPIFRFTFIVIGIEFLLLMFVARDPHFDTVVWTKLIFSTFLVGAGFGSIYHLTDNLRLSWKIFWWIVGMFIILGLLVPATFMVQIPHSTEGYKSRGNAYLDKSKYDQAISDYSKAIEVNPKHAYYDQGLTYEDKDNPDQAILDCTKAIKINFNDVNAWYNRGIAYDAKGNHDQAISDYTKVIAINPNFAEVYNNRGTAYNKQGNHNQAVLDYSKAIEINPKFAIAYYNRGNAQDEKGNHNQAILDFTKAIEINPNYAEAYHNRAIAYVLMQEYGQAGADVHKAEGLGFKISPTLLEALKKASLKDERKEVASQQLTQQKEISNKHFNKIHYLFGDFTKMSMRINKGIMFGDQPEEDALYGLGGMEIIQKLQDGFLISARSDYQDPYMARNSIMFLYNPDFHWDFHYNSPLDSFYAYYVGIYEYQAVTGFNKQVRAFRIFDYEGTKNEEHRKIIEELKNKMQ